LPDRGIDAHRTGDASNGGARHRLTAAGNFFRPIGALARGAVNAQTAAAPHLPSSDQQVLETLPARAADPRMRELSALRRELAADPQRLDVAVRLARRYYEEAAAEGDPRYVGYAQAALAPWWNQPAPPEPGRGVRAILLQFGHQFDAALADLAAVLKADPANGEAWAWQAAIQMVQARYPEARRACEGLAPLAAPLIAATCIANVDSVTGKAAAAAAAIRAALRDADDAGPAERLWVLTRLAEIEERRGDYPAAEAAYRDALALNLTDGYLLAAYADFLLDRGRPAEVLALLKDKTRSDLLLLRLALAAKALKAPQLAAWQGDLKARFDAARLRGDKLHQKEESRDALQLEGDAPRALALASENYRLQREPADARVLLEAALAARAPAAAEPVLTWMADSGIESAVLRKLAAELKGHS
jgi:predicted Zn-dependent protease